MAEPVEFEGMNYIFGPPEGYTEDEIGRLPVRRDDAESISFWKFTAEELAEINRTGGAYFSVLMGGGQCPIWVSAFLPPPMKRPYHPDEPQSMMST